jgi:hypothetical protein
VSRAIRMLPPLLTALAFAGQAAAQDIDGMVGRWTGYDRDDCIQADTSEAAPLRIARDGDVTSIGNFGWLCGIKNWQRQGPFLTGAGDCASEGGDDDFRSRFMIGLADANQLVMARDGVLTVLRRCQ